MRAQAMTQVRLRCMVRLGARKSIDIITNHWQKENSYTVVLVIVDEYIILLSLKLPSYLSTQPKLNLFSDLFV